MDFVWFEQECAGANEARTNESQSLTFCEKFLFARRHLARGYFFLLPTHTSHIIRKLCVNAPSSSSPQTKFKNEHISFVQSDNNGPAKTHKQLRSIK